MTDAEARFNNSLLPRKPEGPLGRTAQDDHLDSHTAPELCFSERERERALILKDSSVRSVWTYLTASPCYVTNKYDRETDISL